MLFQEDGVLLRSPAVWCDVAKYRESKLGGTPKILDMPVMKRVETSIYQHDTTSDFRRIRG
jgi:hypothetical protein